MRRRLVLGAVAALAMMAPSAVSLAQPGQAPAQRDWTQVIAATSEGGFRIGNPDAPVKVVEYLSLTCPHCADFAREGTPALIQNYVRRGRVSLELRNFVLNPVDIAATLVARCGTPTSFVRLSEHLFATQPQWVGRFEAVSQEQRTELSTLPPAQRLARMAEIGGLTQAAAQHGVSPEESRRCLSDPGALARLGEMQQAASALGVRGTPSFLINGTLAPVNNWGALEPLIRQAGG